MSKLKWLSKNLLQGFLKDPSWGVGFEESAMNMKPVWHIADVIDLEYFLNADEDMDDAVLSFRDRDIFLKDIFQHLNSRESFSNGDRKTAIRIWLENRRKTFR